MHNDPNPTMPPPSLLEALRQPRRTQLGDPCVTALLAQWKERRSPIAYTDLQQVADMIGVKDPDAKTRRRIVAAVEAAGIEIYDLRRGLNETFAHVQLTGDGWVAITEQSRWCEPEEWDARHSQPRPPAAPPPEWLKEGLLDQEYGPTLERLRERLRWRERCLRDPLWFLAPR